MTITCDTMMDFILVIKGLVENGIGFKAHTRNLTIELTGAY